MTHKITREYEKKMSEISPFELKNILIDLADESARKSTHIMLNAGRGQSELDQYRAPRSLFPARASSDWKNVPVPPNMARKWSGWPVFLKRDVSPPVSRNS